MKRKILLLADDMTFRSGFGYSWWMEGVIEMKTRSAYIDQLKDPKGKIYWGKRRIQSVEWDHNLQMGEITFTIPYEVDDYLDHDEKLRRIQTAVVIKARDYDHDKNDDMLGACQMTVKLTQDPWICLLVITTRSNDIHNYFKRLQREQK